MFLFLRYRSSQSDISTQNAEDTNHYYVIVQLTSGHEQQDTAQFVRNILPQKREWPRTFLTELRNKFLPHFWHSSM